MQELKSLPPRPWSRSGEDPPHTSSPHILDLYVGPLGVHIHLGRWVSPAGQDWEAGYETKRVSCAKGEVNRNVEGKGEMGMRLGLGRYVTSWSFMGTC